MPSRKHHHRISANESAALYWSERLGFGEVPQIFREVVREHDSSLFNIAYERLQVAKMNGPVRDPQGYFCGALIGMVNDRNSEKSGRRAR